MKYFKYWAEEKHKISIFGKAEEITLLVGSNESEESAKHEASLRAKRIEKRIAESGPREEYEVGIREHISDVIDESNVISICRYGAKVLNTERYTVLDLDDYAKSLWDIFKPMKRMDKKEKIVFKFQEFVSKHPEFGSDFRIYETTKGIRVIGKKYLDPADKKNIRLMGKLNVDWLYVVLSQKQQCYRARITPKPYRLRIKTIKVKSPLFCQSDTYKNWANMYDEASRNYTVARYIKSIGRDFSSDKVIKYHDERCNSHQGFSLA